jgi:quinol monooxygenase YgiN
MESIVAENGSDAPGFLGSRRYEVLDNPNILVEIADWESAEARMTHMQEAMVSGVYAPLSELLAAPFRATVIRQLP